MTTNRWLTLALIISVGANLLLAGVLIGRYMHEPPDRAPLDWAAREMSTETRQQLQSHMREHRHEARPLRRELRESQVALREAVATEPYDPEQVREAFARVQRASAALQVSMHEHISETLADLSPEDRQKLFRVLLRGGDRGHPPPPRPSP